MEIWKSIPGYSKYEVSNNFCVRNKKTGFMLKVVTTIFDHPYSSQVGLRSDVGGGSGSVFLDEIVLFLF